MVRGGVTRTIRKIPIFFPLATADHCRKTIWNLVCLGRVYFPSALLLARRRMIIRLVHNNKTVETHNNNCRGKRNNSTLISFLKIKNPPAPVGISARISLSLWQSANTPALLLLIYAIVKLKEEKHNTKKKRRWLIFPYFSNEKMKCK